MSNLLWIVLIGNQLSERGGGSPSPMTDPDLVFTAGAGAVLVTMLLYFVVGVWRGWL
jgi:hypothetical protein